jgi:cytochrome c
LNHFRFDFNLKSFISTLAPQKKLLTLFFRTSPPNKEIMRRIMQARTLCSQTILVIAFTLPAIAQFSYPNCTDLKDGDFRKLSLIDKINHPELTEPMKLDIAKDGRLFWIERAGAVKVYEPGSKKITLLLELSVTVQSTRGGLGLSLDPEFTHNNWVYLGYTPKGSPPDRHQISRFTLVADRLQDEIVLLKIPLLANTGNHATAAMAWDKSGNLFISLGDAISPFNSDPYFTDGYSPLVSQNSGLDARRTAGNTNDLNGKILRIHPENNGSYTIPVGNLFPAGTTGTRSEIYSMGHRNPYTIWFDSTTGWLFVGEVGPDALTADPERGPSAQDEFNVIKSPGNYGWPYLGGNNIPYNQYDYEAKKTGTQFDPTALQNLSPFNTGLKNIPPGRPALLSYGHDGKSPDQIQFPLLGGALGGAPIGLPVYRYRGELESKIKLPPHFDGKWFIADHQRLWFLMATLDPLGEKIVKVQNPFPGLTFHGVTGGTIGPDGALYLIEYGEVDYSSSSAQRISRVEYQGSCLPTVATRSLFPSIGRQPMQPRLKVDLGHGQILVYPQGKAGHPVNLWGRTAIPN